MSPVPEHPTVITTEGALGRVESKGPEEHNGEMLVLVMFESGERLWVPADQLILQEDGHFQLQMPLADLSAQHTRPTIAVRPSDLDKRLAELDPEPTQQRDEHTKPEASAQDVAEAARAQPNSNASPEEASGEGRHHEEATTKEGAAAAGAGLEHVRVSQVVEARREDIGALLMREEVEVDRVPINEYVDEAPPVRYEGDRIIIPVLEEVLHVEKRLLVKEEVVITKQRRQYAAEQRTLREVTHVLAAPEGAALMDDEIEPFRRHFEANKPAGARSFEFYEPAYRFGHSLGRAPRYQSSEWDSLEAEARDLWERDNPATWDKVKPAIRYAWSQAQRD